MRKAFIKTLTELSKNSNIYVLTGDTGFKVFDKYQKLFPSRYLNVGLSEANMIGISARKIDILNSSKSTLKSGYLGNTCCTALLLAFPQ